MSSETNPLKRALASPEASVGRGTPANPGSRFDRIHLEPDPDMEIDPEELSLPHTQYFDDHSATCINYNDSPDIGFEASINPYRGCEHGCIYCYARPTHEYLGLSAGLDFESKIMVKRRAPELLRKELAAPKWKPQTIAMSGVTDCYQPVERRLKITRSCLEILAEFRNPVGIVTKNFLVTRDIDVLQELARHQCVVVFVSVTTLDDGLRRVMEPRTAPPSRRLQAIEKLANAGIPVGFMVAPVIPGINDHEITNIVRAAVDAGGQFAGKVVLRLPYGLGPLFEDWLERHFPDRKEKVLNQIRSMREGKLNNAEFGTRMTGQGKLAEQITDMFQIACRRAGIDKNWPKLTTANFRRLERGQMELL